MLDVTDVTSAPQAVSWKLEVARNYKIGNLWSCTLMLQTSVKDRFSSASEFIFTCFAYDAERPSSSGLIKDSLFAGTLSGHIASFPIAQRTYGDKAAEREISPVYFPHEEKHYSQITCLLIAYDLVISTDGTIDSEVECLLSGSMDRTVKIWTKNVRDGLNYSSIQTLSGHNGKLTAIVTTPQQGILTSSYDGTFRLYTRSKKPQSRPTDELISNIRYYLFECVGIFGDTKNWLTSLVLLKAISPYGNWTLYISNSEGNIHLYRSSDTSSMLAERKHPSMVKYTSWYHVHQLEILSMTLIQSQSVIITLSNDNTSKVIDTSKGVTFFTIRNSNCRYSSVAWLPLGNYLLYCDESGNCELVSLSKEKSLTKVSIASHRAQPLKKIKSIVKLPVVLQLATHLKLRNSVFTLFPSSSEVVLLELDIAESRIEISGHSTRIICISNLTAMYIHPELHTTNRQRITYQEMPIFSIDAHGLIRCWDDYDNKFRFELNERYSAEVTSMLVVWSLNAIVTGHEDGSLFLWSLSTNVKQQSSALNGAIITSMTTAYLNPTDYLLIAGDSMGRVSITNMVSIENQKVGGDLSIDRIFQGYLDNGEEPGILCLCYWEENSIIISGGEDCFLRAWGITSSRLVLFLKSPTGDPISSITIIKEYMVMGDEMGNACLCRLSQELSSEPRMQIEILQMWSPLPPARTDTLSLPSAQAIIACYTDGKYVYISRSAENAASTEIWRTPMSQENYLPSAERVKTIHHESYTITCSELSFDSELNPLGGNKLLLGTAEGLILKYLIID